MQRIDQSVIMTNSQAVKELMNQIHDLEDESCEALRQIQQSKSKGTFPVSSQYSMVPSSHLNLNVSLENRLTFRNHSQNEQPSKQTFRSFGELSQQPSSSKVMSEKGILDEPFYTVSVLSGAQNRDMETVMMQNHYLRKKVGRLESKLDKYREIIATLANLINTQ